MNSETFKSIQGSRLDGRSSNPGRGNSSLQNVQTGFGDHPASYQKRPGPEGKQVPPSSAEVKTGGAIPPLPHVSMTSVLN
jgi:hypothetical protein